eukprot:jgi/Psemu1/5134/gm1.5134_g
MEASTVDGTNGDVAVVLPGYEAGIDQSGVEHSRRKLRESADRLSATLSEIDCRELPDTGEAGGNRNQQQQRRRRQSLPAIHTLECHSENETWTYRCRCNFQIVAKTMTKSSPGARPHYRYAMRSKGRPVLLATKNTFPIATLRIQAAMSGLMAYLNGDDDDGRVDRDRDRVIGHHLTSCTFSSAWRDTPDADCVLTLHYDHPLETEAVRGPWKAQARELRHRLGLRQLNGRSKGTLLSVRGGVELELEPKGEVCVEPNAEHENTDDEKEATLRDTVYLLPRHCGSKEQQERSRDNDDDDNDDNTTKGRGWIEWSVSLEPLRHDASAAATPALPIIPVRYDKPETAFYHPNPNAMTKALAWMLNRLASISRHNNTNNNTRGGARKLKLLEMYCGCGAHTVALGRSGLVASILAVELDPRLVRACERNISNNGLQEVVEIRKGDAGRWAREESRRSRRRWELQRQHQQQRTETTNLIDTDESNNSNGGDDQSYTYDVLLVDPPRQGLDNEVCKMAMMSLERDGARVGNGDVATGTSGCFRNLLYVSCGHQALLRDLERLSPAYEVVDCAQMDLFPRTDSIETLVHLRKRGL